jgi:hypothetical protein
MIALGSFLSLSRESFVNAFYAFLGLSHLGNRSMSGSIYKMLNTLHLKATGRGGNSLYGSRSIPAIKSKSPRGEREDKKASRSGSAIEEELTDPLTEEDVEAVIAYRCLKSVVARQEGDEFTVEINWFGDMLKWFGPLKRDDSILSTIRAMLRYPYHTPSSFSPR